MLPELYSLNCTPLGPISIKQVDYELEICMRGADNLTVLVEFLLKSTSNNGFQLFPNALLNCAP